MGCMQSKIENEETVARCKDRKHFMKEAVASRNAFAAAHSSYAVSLKNTGAALSDYAVGEVLHSAVLPAGTAGYETLPPPPPPLPEFPRSSLQRASTDGLSDRIVEEENEDEEEIENETGGRTPPESGTMEWDSYIFSPGEDVAGPSLVEERCKRGEGGGVDDEVEVGEMARQQQTPAGSWSGGKQVVDPMEGRTRGGKGVNMLVVFGNLDDCFLKASESSHEVSKMLQANRLHYHSNFADNRGHIDHAARIMRVITWNTSFGGLPNAVDDDGLEDDFDSEEHETHATVLDKMLAWEKKLYEEVKTAEQMKLDYQKKVASLQKLKKNGSNHTEAMEKTKAAVSHLHTRYIVDMQSMDSTVSEINRLRDEQLYPKLVALVDGMAKMWETMRMHHENQSKIVTALRYLDISQAPKETSEHHHERTLQLCVIVQEWRLQFEKLMTHQKDYIKVLNDWLRLNFIPIDDNLKEKASTPQVPRRIQALLHAWYDYLEKLPDEPARTAIHNFAGVVNTIVEYQVEEMKLRDKCEDTRKELTRKTRQFEDWFNKYMQRRTPHDETDQDMALDKDLIAERQSTVEIVKKKLDEDVEAYQKHCIQVREKSLMSLRTQLPELFRAMSNFSINASNTYRKLRAISQTHKPNERAVRTAPEAISQPHNPNESTAPEANESTY